jgi:hypothetical protein
LPAKSPANASSARWVAAERLPVARHRVRVVRGVRAVLGERRALAEVERLRVDVHLDPELGEGAEQQRVEVRARGALDEREPAAPAVAGQHVEPVVDEVERDLDVAIAGRHRARRQPPGVT